jgi:hypothetical protein
VSVRRHQTKVRTGCLTGTQFISRPRRIQSTIHHLAANCFPGSTLNLHSRQSRQARRRRIARHRWLLRRASCRCQSRAANQPPVSWPAPRRTSPARQRRPPCHSTATPTPLFSHLCPPAVVLHRRPHLSHSFQPPFTATSYPNPPATPAPPPLLRCT